MKCPSCGYENSDDARYCSLCQASFAKANTELPGLDPLQGLKPEPGKEAKKAVQKILRSQPTGLNWFQRHLNWTWVFAAFGIGTLHIAVVIWYLFYNLDSYSDWNRYFSGSQLFPSGSLLAFIASILIIEVIFLVLQGLATYGVGAWVLKRKARSLWWLLIFVAVLPIGLLYEGLGAVASFVAIIWFLCLKNYNVLEEMPESAATPETSGSIQPGLVPPGFGAQSRKYGP